MINSEWIKGVVKKFETPLYLFDLAELKGRVGEIRKHLGGDIELCYAMKANPFLISYLDEVVDRFEVCSFGEYEICAKEHIISDKIVFSGVYKEEKETQYILEKGFDGEYTIESRRQFLELYEAIKESSQKIRILLRLTSGNQFGMDKSEIIRIVSDKEKMEHFQLSGIHYFSGTQKKNREMFIKELDEIDEYCCQLYKETGVSIKKIEYGPGLYIDYFGGGQLEYGDLEYLSEELHKKDYKFVIELGRYIAATCGRYITSVVDVKSNMNKNYCMVDGGINHINYYGQMLGLRVPKVDVIPRTDNKEKECRKWNVCGALCTVGDVLLRDYELESPEIGDLLVFNNTGAYSVTEAMFLFLSRKLPQILVMDENQNIELIRDGILSSEINSRGKRR